MSISQQKTNARKQAYVMRKAAHSEAPLATQNLLEYVKSTAPKIIAAYMPIRTEIDTLAAMTTLFALGHRICVPVIVRAGLPLSFREWTPECEMQDGPFGAKVPVSGDWLSPDLLVVPLLVFDTQGYRLGYGGGFYDRSLELLRAKRPVLAAGFAYAAQEGEVPVEDTDQRLDAIITEKYIKVLP